MALTVGIVTRGDEPRTLCRTIEHVLRSAAPVSADAEILVVVNGSGSRIPDLDVYDPAKVRVRYLDKRNVAVARNTVLDEARHDTILFTDDDCVVPREWCAQLYTALREPDCAVVSAPVRVEVNGPISAFLDYRRAFDPIPPTAARPMLLVTTNCGLRRDRLPAWVRFDPRSHTAGEDTGFSLTLGRAGIEVHWLSHATPISHGASERIEELTYRFQRNARHGLDLYLRRGCADAAMPGLLSHYRTHLREDYGLYRRFSEFPAAAARTAFSVYEVLMGGATAIGYLDQIGQELGLPLVRLDADGFAQAARVIAARVREATSHMSTVDWRTLEVDYRGMGERLGQPEPMLADVRATLRTYAPPTDVDPVGPAADLLEHGAAESGAHFLHDVDAVRAAFDRLAGAPGPCTAEHLERAVWPLGVPLKVATDAIEFSLLFDYRRLARALGPRRGQ